jgi:MFS family permease
MRMHFSVDNKNLPITYFLYMNKIDAPAFSPFRIICAIGFFAIFSSTISKSPVLPLFAKDLGGNESIIGLIAAASTIVGILISLPAGVLSDIFGRKKIILAATFIFATAPFLYLPVTQSWQLVLVRIYHGFATAIFSPVALAMIADLFSASRGEKMGWYSSSTLIGRSIAPFIGGFLLTLFAASMLWHYRSVYLVCGISGVIAFLLACMLPSPPKTIKPDLVQKKKLSDQLKEMGTGLAQVGSNRGILFTSATEAVQYFGYGAYEVFLPLYAKSLGMADWLIGILLGVKVLVLTFSKPMMGKISDKSGRRGQIVIGMLCGAIGLGFIPFLNSFWGLLVLSIFLGISMATVTSSTAALVADLSKGAHGSAMGIMHTIMDVGHASGPIVVGFVITFAGYHAGFYLVGALFVLAAVTFPIAVKKNTIQ